MFRRKPGRVVLVTDAVAWRAKEHTLAGPLTLRGGAPRLADGTLAGSTLTMDRAVRFVVQQAGVDLGDAVAAAATTPPDLLSIADRGRLIAGARADMVSLSPDLALRDVDRRRARLTPPAPTPLSAWRLAPPELGVGPPDTCEPGGTGDPRRSR